MTYETSTTSRTLKGRVVVPPTVEIINMSDDELTELRAELVDAQTVIEAQISAARASGDIDAQWLVRSNGALAHMRRGLSAIKSEMIKRTGHYKPNKMPSGIQPGFEALDVIKDVLRDYRTLLEAVHAFLDDDGDEQWAALCVAAGRDEQ